MVIEKGVWSLGIKCEFYSSQKLAEKAKMILKKVKFSYLDNGNMWAGK